MGDGVEVSLPVWENLAHISLMGLECRTASLIDSSGQSRHSEVASINQSIYLTD